MGMFLRLTGGIEECALLTGVFVVRPPADGRGTISPREQGFGPLGEVQPVITLFTLCVEHDVPTADIAGRW